jgi:DNA topoisomerase-1
MGSKRFRYEDASGNRIVDEEQLERIRALAIPPAWKDVRIASNSRAKLQATGYDAAGRKQYLYHQSFREQQEQAKYDRLIRFAERLPDLRAAMSEHIDLDGLPPERVAALAVRLINIGWFRVGSDRYAKTSRTFGITTLRKSHVRVRGARISFEYRGKHRIWVRSAIVETDLAAAMRELIALPKGTRLFRFDCGDGTYGNLDARRLNDYIQTYLGEEFTAKDFRTWGGTLLAAIALAELEPPSSETEAKRCVAAVMRRVGERLGKHAGRGALLVRQPGGRRAVPRRQNDRRFPAPAFARRRGSRHGLDPEELATLSLLRSWRIRAARAAA